MRREKSLWMWRLLVPFTASVCRYLLTSASTNTNSQDPDQAAHIGTVWFGPLLFGNTSSDVIVPCLTKYLFWGLRICRMWVRLASCPSPDSTDSYLINCFHLVSWCNASSENFDGVHKCATHLSPRCLFITYPHVSCILFTCVGTYMLCVRAAGVLPSPRVCADSSEPLPVASLMAKFFTWSRKVSIFRQL